MENKKVIFAVHSDDTQGRFFQENSQGGVRGIYSRDRDRVIHSQAFRRLKGKTQVFMSTDVDHHRTRLTHTLEVAQIARTIARYFSVDEDLTECIALSHDLGHPPYGHVGESALNACMENLGGFDHNGQSLRIVTDLEHKYPLFDGLNLTWETLEGIVKHNGPIVGAECSVIRDFNQKWDLKLETYASFEAQIAAISDDVAYNHHDIDDGHRAGYFTVQDLHNVPYIAGYIDKVSEMYPALSERRLVAECVRSMLHDMVMDIITTTQSNIDAHAPHSVDDIRMADRQIVTMSETMETNITQVRRFLQTRVYHSEKMADTCNHARKVVKSLFDMYMNDVHQLPNSIDAGISDREKARLVADYVSGMTDHFADKRYNEFKND